MKRTFPICSVATAETRTGRRAVDRARAAVDPRGPVTEAPARRAVCCLNANIFFPQLSFASRELARSGPARVVPREVQTWVRSCGAARWCRARCFVEQRVRSRVGNCQFGGGAFFGQTRPKSRRVVAVNHGETPNPIHHDIQCRLCTAQKKSALSFRRESYGAVTEIPVLGPHLLLDLTVNHHFQTRFQPSFHTGLFKPFCASRLRIHSGWDHIWPAVPTCRVIQFGISARVRQNSPARLRHVRPSHGHSRPSSRKAR